MHRNSFLFISKTMAFTFVLIAAICVAEGLAFNSAVENPISELVEENPLKYEETMEECMVVDANSKADDEYIKKCVSRLRGPYEKQGMLISEMVKNTSQEMLKELKDKYPKYAKRAERPLKNIENSLGMLPSTISMLINIKDYNTALKTVTETKKKVEENSRNLSQIMREMSQEVPEAARKAEKMAREIRKVSKTGYDALMKSFCLCIKGGIQALTEDDSKVEENPQQ